MELLWRVVEEIIDASLRASVCLHDVLHGFCAGKITGMDILKLTLVQEFASVYHDPLFLVFLDPCKAYDKVYCGRLLVTLEVYGAGSHMCRLLSVF